MAIVFIVERRPRGRSRKKVARWGGEKRDLVEIQPGNNRSERGYVTI